MDAPTARPSGPKDKSPARKETERLRAENEKLAAELCPC